MTPSSPVQCPVSEEGPTSSPVAPLARPVAVRKPLALGSSSEHITEGTKSNAEDKNTQNHSPPSLKVPQIVYRPTAFHFKDHRGQPNIHTILNWEEEKDDDSDSGEEKSGSASELVLAEEDLNGECVCVDCEQKMLDALSPGMCENTYNCLTDTNYFQIIPRLGHALREESILLTARKNSV